MIYSTSAAISTPRYISLETASKARVRALQQYYGATIDKLKQHTVPVEQLLIEQEQRKNWLFEKLGRKPNEPNKLDKFKLLKI